MMVSSNWTTNERLLSANEVASYLGAKRDTLYKWITRKNLPCYKIGRLKKFKLVEVEKWVNSTLIINDSNYYKISKIK